MIAPLARHGGLILVATTLIVAVLPLLGLDRGTSRLILLICILGLVTSGMNLSYGYAGELSLGQAAVYGGAAYIGAFIAKNLVNDLLVCLLAGIGLALLLGLITGLPGLRLGGWVLAVCSFFLVLLLPVVVNLLGPLLGGFTGMAGIPSPKVFGLKLTPNAFYMVIVVITGLWFLVLRNLVISRHGAAFLVLKQSPVLARSLGISPYSLKLKAYAVGAIPAGIAGVFFAYLDSFISPETFTIDLAITILAACVIGGATSIYGGLLGAAFLQLGPLRATFFQDYAIIAYGVLLVLGGVVFKAGLAGIIRSLVRKVPGSSRPPFPRQETTGSFSVQAGRELVVSNISKSFGGNAAVRDVSFIAKPGQITALIGPNGSGKTTVLNLISGYYRIDAGDITLGGERLAGASVHAIARAGVGRTFQTPIIPQGLTVREVLGTANYMLERGSMGASVLRTPTARRLRVRDFALADELLNALGISAVGDLMASSLPLGTRRMVELGRALIVGRGLLMLDEVAAGLDESEIEELIEMLRRLRDAGATVLLVEHNFALVRALSDVVVVLAGGRVIADGTPAQVEAHPEVLESYLGEGAGVSGTRSRSGDEGKEG